MTNQSADISEKRQSSLAVLTKLRETLPDFIAARDSINQHVSEAKQNTSYVLKSFLLKVIEIKTNSLQSTLKLEAATLAFGANVDNWCWQSNAPMLEGIMGWIGTDYSECIMQLDDSVSKIIGSIYADFYEKEISTNFNFSLFDAFGKRNIINNPQSIDETISNSIVNLRNAIPEFGSDIYNFEQSLNGTLPVYSDCLSQRLNIRKLQIKLLKQETQRCIDDRKPQV